MLPPLGAAARPRRATRPTMLSPSQGRCGIARVRPSKRQFLRVLCPGTAANPPSRFPSTSSAAQRRRPTARQIQLDIEIGDFSQIKVPGRKGDQLRAEIYAVKRQSCSDQGHDEPSAHPLVLKRIARLLVFLILRLRYWRPMCWGYPDWPAVFPDPFLRRRRPMCDVVSRLIVLDPDFLSVSRSGFDGVAQM